jgi:hypothetical protein
MVANADDPTCGHANNLDSDTLDAAKISVDTDTGGKKWQVYLVTCEASKAKLPAPETAKPRIRMMFDTDEILRHAIVLRAAKESVCRLRKVGSSELLNELLTELLRPEIEELKRQQPPRSSP